MDVISRGAKAFLLGLILFNVGCAKEKTEESVFRKSSEECAGDVVKSRYIVQWSDGKVTVEQSASDADFKANFIKTNLNSIELAEPDFKIHLSTTPLAAGSRNWLETTDNWGPERIEAPKAWAKGAFGQPEKGDPILVGIVDSGVDIFHSQLQNQIAYNLGESGLDGKGRDKRTNGVDDDGNGYIDDYNGQSFMSGPTPEIVPHLHGTHVGGIVAAEHQDTTISTDHVQGIAPKARIVPIQFIEGDQGGYLSDAVMALDYAIARKVKIINASWGGQTCSKTLKNKIASLANFGILFIAAAGNDSSDIDTNPSYPGGFDFPGQITVGSSTFYDGMASHSNYGFRLVHLFAPGEDVISTVLDNTVRALSGTSMATPFVTGAAAVVWGHRPKATLQQVKSAILSSVDEFDGFYNSTRGRLNVAKALVKIEAMVSP